MPKLNLKKFLSRKQFINSSFLDAVYLYLAYLVISITTFSFNLYIGQKYSGSMSINPDSVIIDYNAPEFFLLKGLLMVILLYFMIIFIQAITTHPIISKIVYLLLAVLVGIFSGRVVGRGLLPLYIGEESVFSTFIVYILHQVSWFGGTLLITSTSEYNEITDFRKIKLNNFLLGVFLLSIPTFVSCLVVIFYKISHI